MPDDVRPYATHENTPPRSSHFRRWTYLCVAATLAGGVSYALVLSGIMSPRVPQPIYTIVVTMCAPGVLVGALTVGSVHAGFGDGALGFVLTTVCSGLFWGSILFAAWAVVRRLTRTMRPRSAT